MPETNSINIGIIGLGNVATGVIDILKQNAEIIKDRIGKTVKVKTIAVRNLNKNRKISLQDIRITTNPADILNDPDIQIVVELIGGENPAYEYLCQALKNKKHVVTANKEVVAKHKKEFFKLAQSNGVDFYYEASVGGGIPLIRTLKIGLAANKIQAIYGILNGTTNYILTKITEEEREFADVLREAQQLGFAESDPSMDISGLDAAYKLVILAAVAFRADIQTDQLFYEGIENIRLKDIQYAKELGYIIKLLAIGKEVGPNLLSFRVHPTMIPSDHPLAGVRNETNAIFIIGNAIGESILAGKGAGASPTGSAVVSDIIDIAFDVSGSRTRRNLDDTVRQITLVPIDEIQIQFYLRLLAPDTPGTLEKIMGVFARNNVSISKIIQKDIKNDQAEIVIVTHKIMEKCMKNAVQEFNHSGIVTKLLSLIRVGLDETA